MRVRRIMMLFLTVWLLPPSIVRAEAPQRHAIVIGINDYADPAIPDLRFAESDAKAIFETLIDPDVGRFKKDHVTLLLGEDATPSAIKAALYKLRGAGKDDLVVIFYSGHGAKEGDEAFWVTQAAERKALPATALRNKDIREFLAKIPSERLVILLDCCYAASTVKKSLDDPAALFGDFAGKGRVTIAGAAENQEALEFEDKKAGVFTHFLVTGLRGQADGNTDGVVTFEELWTYLGDNVRKASVKQGGLHEPKIITEAGVTPQFLLTFNPAVRAENEQAVAALRKLFDERKISGAQYDDGFKALSEPAIDAEAIARREVFADLTAGRLAPKYLKSALNDRLEKARAAAPAPSTPSGKPTLAVVPFDTLGQIKAKDAGKILAEHLLPHFAGNYTLIDQTQLKHFLDQDDLTLAGLAEMAKQPRTKALSKAVKLRAVRYLIVGTISGLPDGSLSVTARMSDWQTGRIEGGRIAQIAAAGCSDLLARMGHLAGKLGGSPGHVEVVSPRPPKDLTLDLGKGVTMEFVLIPAGEFMMGSKLTSREVVARYGGTEEHQYRGEHPRHKIRILSPFWLGKHEVTVAQFGRFVEATGYKTDAEEGGQDSEDGKKGGQVLEAGKKWAWSEEATWRDAGLEQSNDHPVVLVSWNDAMAMCRWLADESGLPVSLPTEAQWEYACRAGTTTVYWWGDEMDETGNVANVANGNYWKHNSMKAMPMDDGFNYAAPVGRYRANGFGLHDTIGNVWEWCADSYDRYPGNTRTSERFGKNLRVIRGGSWNSFAGDCRCADRDGYIPDNRHMCIGFRLSAEAQ